MSTMTAHIFGYPQADRVIVPAPNEPMSVAREVIRALYTDALGVVLRDHRGDLHRWTGMSWPELELRDVRSAVYQFLERSQYVQPTEGVKPFAPNRKKVDDVIDALRAIVLLDSSADAPTWAPPFSDDPPAAQIVSMANGLLHVPTRTLLPHTPRVFNHHSLPFSFEVDAPEPSAWLEFLRQLWVDDEASIATLQEAMGYILGGDTRLQKIFLLVGPKRAGKGTIGRVLTGLLGGHNVAAPTLANLATNFGLQPLINCPLALIADARLSSWGDGKIVVERLLSISGEDSLTVDRKYRDPWTGRLPTRFVILTNELPRLADASGALASRFIALVLTRSFYGGEDVRLTDRLLSEAPAIFNWALQGLDRLNARGHFVNPEAGVEAIQQLEDLSSPVLAFIRDSCQVGPFEVKVERLWLAWKRWCESDNRHAGTREVFGRDLRAAVPTVRRVKARSEDGRIPTYVGIALRTPDQGGGPADLGPPGYDHRHGPGGPRADSYVGPAEELDSDGAGDVER
ncbi:MAG TPA: phage/plasmid primase, P4 family [Vicinamibacterales bacterium]|nr:phage/plasmid primase, P4 family [Vicinamibacterales bacterium]